ncbi:MAG: DHH family phosphoesterase [Oscillospiraceae bacterium]|nr:DHH family phosphoesterase [Oscillospiraceae bacterium]
MDWNKLVSLLQGHRVFIQTHNFPDPDAIASAYGLQVFLKVHGVAATICHTGKIERYSTQQMLALLPIELTEASQIHDMTSDDYIVTVDAQKYNANLTDLPGDEVACIDHHPTFIPCDYAYRDVRIVGSCSTLVAQYFLESGTPLPQEAATALLYGLRIDTADLSRGVTDLDVDMFAMLHKHANQILLRRMHSSTMEFDDLKAYGAAIENIHIFGETGFARIPFDCPDALIAMVSDFILSLSEITCSIVYSVRSDGLKFSVRSEIDAIHCGRLAAAALQGLGSGGGHASMAGGFVPAESYVRLGDSPSIADGALRQRFMGHIARMLEEKKSV